MRKEGHAWKKYEKHTEFWSQILQWKRPLGTPTQIGE